MSLRELPWVVCTENHAYECGEVVKEGWTAVALCHTADDAERVAMGLSALEKTRFYISLRGQRPHVSYYQLGSKNERPYGIYANEQL